MRGFDCVLEGFSADRGWTTSLIKVHKPITGIDMSNIDAEYEALVVAEYEGALV